MKSRHEEITPAEKSAILHAAGESVERVNDLLWKIKAYDANFGDFSPELKKEWLRVQEKAGLHALNPMAGEGEVEALLAAIEKEVLRGQ